MRAHQDSEIEDLHADLGRLARLLEDQKLKNAGTEKLLQEAQEELERMHKVVEQMKRVDAVKDGRMRELQREARARADCVGQLSKELRSLHEELARKEEEWSRKRIFLQSRGFDTQDKPSARGMNLAEAARRLASQKHELDVLRKEHDKCPAVIAELRKQIWDTQDALEMDYDLLEGRAGIIAGGLPRQSVPAASGDDTCATERHKRQVSALSVIASLRKELFHTRIALEQHAAALASKDVQIAELNAGLVHLDKSLAQELDGRLVLSELAVKLEDMLVGAEKKIEDHRQGLSAWLAGKEAKMRTMSNQLAEADQRLAFLSGGSWVCVIDVSDILTKA